MGNSKRNSAAVAIKRNTNRCTSVNLASANAHLLTTTPPTPSAPAPTPKEKPNSVTITPTMATSQIASARTTATPAGTSLSRLPTTAKTIAQSTTTTAPAAVTTTSTTTSSARSSALGRRRVVACATASTRAPSPTTIPLATRGPSTTAKRQPPLFVSVTVSLWSGSSRHSLGEPFPLLTPER